MGECKFCGNDAALLRGKHKACQQTRDGWFVYSLVTNLARM